MDLKIKTETEEFHGRTCGIIKQENKFLIMRVNKTPYYHIPGGHIEIGEDSEQAIIREIKEELGADIEESEIMSLGCVPDEFNDSPEVTHVYFWHDKQNKITGCYEDYPIYLDCITEAAQYSSVMEYTKWLMKICFDLGLVK